MFFFSTSLIINCSDRNSFKKCLQFPFKSGALHAPDFTACARRKVALKRFKICHNLYGTYTKAYTRNQSVAFSVFHFVPLYFFPLSECTNSTKNMVYVLKLKKIQCFWSSSLELYFVEHKPQNWKESFVNHFFNNAYKHCTKLWFKKYLYV